MTERLNIEIDYCPQCRGVWLDRGELDKIIERSVNETRPLAVAPPQSLNQAPAQQQHYDGGHGHEYRSGHGDGHGYHGKKPFWKELFD
jgi:Zn-finger nucleic acid-binding protein